MINLKALIRKTQSPQLTANEIDPVQRPPAWLEREDGNSELIGAIDCFGKDAAPNEDQTSTSVSNDERRRTLHGFRPNVASPVLDPAKVVRRVKIADLARFTLRHDCVHGSEVSHPFCAELDGFIVRGSPLSWFRRLSHVSRLHPSSDSRPTRPCSSGRPRLVGGES